MLYTYIFTALIIFLIIFLFYVNRKIRKTLFTIVKKNEYSYKLLTPEFLNDDFMFLGSYELIDNFLREEVQKEFLCLEVYMKKESLVKDLLPSSSSFLVRYKLGYYDQVPTMEELFDRIGNCTHEEKRVIFESLLISLFEWRLLRDTNPKVVLRYKKDGKMTAIKEIECYNYEEIPTVKNVLAGGFYSCFECNGVVIAQILTVIS